ncbi:MAG: MraY family glycosyltransferase [Rikenellaceae bacterium]
MITTILPLLISGIIVTYLLPQVMLLSLKKRLVDRVNSRKVHTTTASRLGGITFCPAILLSVFLTISLIGIVHPSILTDNITIKFTLDLSAIFILYFVGLYDDVIGVDYNKKFLAQIASALLIIASGSYLQSLYGIMGIWDIPSYVGIPLTIALIVFIVNAMNLIDGIDGLASLLSIMALTVYGILFASHDYVYHSIISFATAGALIPFCYSNIFGIRRGITSKIFMGDSGSLVIGTVLAILAIKLCIVSEFEYIAHENWISEHFFVMAYTMLMLPCFDVVRVILHRTRAKTPLFKPDKNHIHHKFLRLGMSQRSALFCILAMNLLFMGLNTTLAFLANINIIVAIDIVIWTILHIFLTNKINKKEQ